MTTDHELLGAVERCKARMEYGLDHSNGRDLKILCEGIQSLLGGGWQDISTAPKDGSDILILSNGCCVCGYWNSREGAFVTFQYGIDSPTHWMPLPLKPTGEL